MLEKAQIMDGAGINRALTRIAHEVIERNKRCSRGSYWLEFSPGGAAGLPSYRKIKEYEGVEIL